MVAHASFYTSHWRIEFGTLGIDLIQFNLPLTDLSLVEFFMYFTNPTTLWLPKLRMGENTNLLDLINVIHHVYIIYIIIIIGLTRFLV